MAQVSVALCRTPTVERKSTAPTCSCPRKGTWALCASIAVHYGLLAAEPSASL